MAEQKVNIVMQLVDKASAGLKNINAQATALAAGALAALTAAVYEGVKAFGEQEKASATLAAAMKNGGTYTKAAAKEIEDFNTQLSRSTIYADEQLTAASAVFAGMGASVKQTQELTKATTDLAAARGIDVETAADMVGKSLSMGTAIKGVAVEIEGAAGSAQRMDSIVKGLGSTFGGRAAADAATFQGSMKQLQNALGELFEKIGSLIAPAIQAVANALTGLMNWFSDLNPALQTTIMVIAGLALGLVALVPVMIAVSAAMGFMSAAAGTFGAIAGVVFAPITLTILAIAAAVAAVTFGIMKLVEFLKGDLDKQIGDTEKKIEKLKEKSKQLQEGGMSEKESAKNDQILADIEELENKKTELINSKQQERDDAEAVKGEERRAKKLQDQADEAALLDEQENAIKEAADAKLAEWDLSAEARRQIELQREIDLENLKGQNADQARLKRLNAEKATVDIRVKMKEDEANKWNNYENFMAGATTSKNKEVQAIAKAMAIKNIIAKTAEAAMGAYSSLAAIPFVGPVLGAIAAGAAIAFGAEQIQQVQALADGGSFVADQPTAGNIGGQPIVFGEAGKEAVTFEPLDGKSSGGNGDVLILSDDGTELAKAIWKKQKDLEAKGVLQ